MFQLCLDVYDVEDFDIQGEFYIVDVLWETRAICDKEAVEMLLKQLDEDEDLEGADMEEAFGWLYAEKEDGDHISVYDVEITYVKKGI